MRQDEKQLNKTAGSLSWRFLKTCEPFHANLQDFLLIWCLQTATHSEERHFSCCTLGGLDCDFSGEQTRSISNSPYTTHYTNTSPAEVGFGWRGVLVPWVWYSGFVYSDLFILVDRVNKTFFRLAKSLNVDWCLNTLGLIFLVSVQWLFSSC